jgi:fucose permease
MITPTNPSQTSGKNTSWFRTSEGKNYTFIFLLVCSLFLLWGVCNGMIDILNKHFQDSLRITKAESAFVQFANYMGYFFMAIPSGLLAIRFGYKGAIIIGLSLVALGAFWFVPATHIGTYWAFLLGLFILAAGLTCLETVANPYATVLGPPESGAPRINLAQSTNGIGWMIGPVLGGFFVLSATGEPITTNTDLYKPYLIVAVVVAIIAFIFVISKVPDLHAMEETKAASDGNAKTAVKPKPLWKRQHFVLAVAAQFFYVAAQTGIFSFFINYIATDIPALRQNAAKDLQGFANGLHAAHLIPPAQMTYSAAMLSANDVTNLSALVAKLQNDPDPKTKPVSDFIWSQFTTNRDFLAASSFSATAGQINAPSSIQDSAADLDKEIALQKKTILIKGFNQVLQTNLLFDAQRFSGIGLSPAVVGLAAQNPSGEQLIRLNRSLVEAAYPTSLIASSPYLNDALFHVTDRGASLLLSFGGFALFLLGRITGTMALRFFKAHTTLALYSVISMGTMVLVMFPLGWWSVLGLFLSFFFMYIMYPTIFALGIHGLGDQTKIASSFIVQAIVGGAIMPLWMGWLADNWGMRIGFLMPLICFAFVAFYGASWQKLEAKDAAVAK